MSLRTLHSQKSLASCFALQRLLATSLSYRINVPVVVKETLNAAKGTDGDVLIPQFPRGEVHDVLLGDPSNGLFNVLGAQAAASGDDLAANILSNSSGAVEREKNRSLELSLGTLDLGGGDIECQASPLAQCEVNEVIDIGQVLSDEVNTPETEGLPPTSQLYMELQKEH